MVVVADYFITDGNPDGSRQRQVHIHARTKADEAIALAAREQSPVFDVAQDAARDQPGHLHAW